MSERSGARTQAEDPPITVLESGTQTIHLENVERSLPPIYDNATVITVQPYNESSHRRPIPISTLDWVSTPRSQLNALSGMHFLAGVEQLEIQQIIDLSTLLGKTEKGDQYRVKVPRAETIYLAMEHQPAGRRKFIGCFGGFDLTVLDQSGETAFTITKNAGSTCLPCPLHKVTVQSASLIGSVEQNFSLIGHSFTVYDESRKVLCNIYGPNVFGCCMYKDAQFHVISRDGSHQIASLIHKWDNVSLDYNMLLTFPVDTDIKLKSLLLSATFLMEYLFFHHVKPSTRT